MRISQIVGELPPGPPAGHPIAFEVPRPSCQRPLSADAPAML